MSGVIGVFVGSASSFNIGRATKNIGRALSEEFTTHLISTENKFAKDVSGQYDRVHGVSEAESILGEIYALRSYLNSFHPDALLQITQPPIHGTIAGGLAAIHDVPFVYRYSGDRFYEYTESQGVDKILHFGLNNLIGRMPLRFADSCITLGPTGKDRLLNRGVSDEDISIIPPIVDQQQFSSAGPVKSLDIERDIGLFVGRLTRKKGKELLEEALPKILERRTDIQFVFIGKQPESIHIPSRYKEYITLIGPVSPDKVPEYYRAASFLIHPSLSEGIPRAVLEANATGIPTIARDVGDVAYATSNVFTTESEFVDLVCEFESLQPSSVDRFTYAEVERSYKQLFDEFKVEQMDNGK